MSERFGFFPGTPRRSLIDEIDAWLCAPALRRLARLFPGGQDLAFVPAPEFYESLVTFVDENWNSRGVVTTERYATEYRDVPVHLHGDVERAANELGMFESRMPSASHYDAVLAPGTQLWSLVLRVGHMSDLRRHGVTSDRYVGLGSHRSLVEEELAAGRELGLAGADEYALLCSIFTRFFGDLIAGSRRADQPGETSPFADSRTDFNTGAGGPAVSVLSTSNKDGTRPTTFDTLRVWAAEARSSPGIERVLFVTQPLYLYQQGAVAIEVLGLDNGLEVEVIGAPNREYLPGFRFPAWPISRILQEVNGTVKRLVSLRSRAMGGQ